MGRLEGKIALITGTGGGQGRAAALRFCAEGATVVGCDVKVEGQEETLELVRRAGGEMTGGAPVDLGDPDEARGWVEDAVGRHGRIDILYNNASAVRFAPIAEMSVEDWQFSVRNELDLIFYVTRIAWPHLIASRGVLINTASVAGWVGAGHGGFAHCATKGAVLAMTRALAAEGAPHGVRAVSISPGPIESPGTAEMLASPEVKQGLEAAVMLGRVGQPEEVVSVAVFLASDEAGYVTGSDITVDGGMRAL